MYSYNVSRDETLTIHFRSQFFSLTFALAKLHEGNDLKRNILHRSKLALGRTLKFIPLTWYGGGGWMEPLP